MKTSELTGAQLNLAVAMAEGYPKDGWIIFISAVTGHAIAQKKTGEAPCAFKVKDLMYSTAWEQGGPIIDRERYSFATTGTGPADEHGNHPVVCISRRALASEGPTHLIAAMRCYVRNKLGDEIELPGEVK